MSESRKIPYIVRFKSAAAVHLEKSYRFILQEAEVLLEDDSKLNEHGAKSRYGLLVTVFLSADSSDSALSTAYAYAESMLSLVSFSVSTITKRCAPFQIIDVDPAKSDRNMVQFQTWPGNLPLARRFREPEMQMLLDRLGTYPETSRGRLLQAVAWYRKSLEEPEPLDCFINVWTGLEAINEPIKKKFDLPREQPTKSCPKCGENVVMTATHAGIAHIITELLGEPEEVWKQARNTRKELVHSFGSLRQVLVTASRLLPPLRKALMRGILELINMPITEQTRFMREPLTVRNENAMTATVTIHDLPAERIISGACFPSIVIANSKSELKKREDGKIVESVSIELKLDGFEGRWTPRNMLAPAVFDPEDSAAEMILTQS